jgi:glycine betaine/choline ABC-type transport system substrate-binding protein
MSLRQKVILPELNLAMDGDWVDYLVSLDDFDANEGQLFLPPEESGDAGSSSALSGEMMNNGASYNIDNSRNEMPRIAELPQHRDIKKARWTRGIVQLRSEVSKYLADKLAKKLNVSSVKVPWSKMKAEDIINWPPDVKFKPVSKMNLNEVKILHELIKEDKLDFTPEFLGRFKIKQVNKWPDNGDQIRYYVTKYLVDKLAKELNVRRFKLPWSKMKAEDIVNWPPDVKFMKVFKMNLNEVKILHELVREDLLHFTPEFLGRLKFAPLNQSGRERKQLISDVTKYLAEKLAKKLNVPSITIPWSQMKADDIINWPSDMKFDQIHRIKINEVRRLHKLANENQLDFTTEFLSRMKSGSNWTISRNQLRSDISTYLADKLAKKLNVSRIRLPWSKMKAEDIINWPSDVKFDKPGQMNFHGLEKIHRLSSDDLLDFSPEFLRRRRVQLAEGKSTRNEPETECNFTMTN